MQREQAREHYRFSEEAWTAMTRQLDLLATAPPAAFGIGRDGTVDPEDEDKASAAGLRGFVRMYAAVFGRGHTVEELAAEMAPYSSVLTYRHWVEVLGGKGGWPGILELREAFQLLRDGADDAEAMATVGVSHRQVKQLAAFGRVSDWQAERLADMAWDAADDGWTGRELMERWNASCPPRMQVGRSRAYEALAEAKRHAGVAA